MDPESARDNCEGKTGGARYKAPEKRTHRDDSEFQSMPQESSSPGQARPLAGPRPGRTTPISGLASGGCPAADSIERLWRPDHFRQLHLLHFPHEGGNSLGYKLKCPFSFLRVRSQRAPYHA